MSRERWEELGLNDLFYEQLVLMRIGEDPEHRELVKQAYVVRGELSSPEASLETMHEGEARVQWWVDELEAGNVEPEGLLGEMLAQAQEGNPGLSSDPDVIDYRAEIAGHLEQVLEDDPQASATSLEQAASDFREQSYPAQSVELPEYEGADTDEAAFSLFGEWFRGVGERIEELGWEDLGYLSTENDFDGPLDQIEEDTPIEGVTVTRLGVWDEQQWLPRVGDEGEEHWTIGFSRDHDGFEGGDRLEVEIDGRELIAEGESAFELAEAFNDALEHDPEQDPGAWAWTEGQEGLSVEFYPSEGGEWAYGPDALDRVVLGTADGARYELTEIPGASFAETFTEQLDAWRAELDEAGWPQGPAAMEQDLQEMQTIAGDDGGL